MYHGVCVRTSSLLDSAFLKEEATLDSEGVWFLSSSHPGNRGFCETCHMTFQRVLSSFILSEEQWWHTGTVWWPQLSGCAVEDLSVEAKRGCDPWRLDGRFDLTFSYKQLPPSGVPLEIVFKPVILLKQPQPCQTSDWEEHQVSHAHLLRLPVHQVWSRISTCPAR